MRRALKINSGLILGGLAMVLGFQNCSEFSAQQLGSQASQVSSGLVRTFSSTTAAEATRNVASDGSLALTPSPSREQLVDSFISNLYRVTLTRAADPEGLAFWRNKFMSGSITCSELANSFVSMRYSVARSSYAAFRDAAIIGNGQVWALYHVKNLNRALLQREGDSEGVAFWHGKLISRQATVPQVEQAFYDSAEFQTICAQLN